jgi:hypothetical protein
MAAMNGEIGNRGEMGTGLLSRTTRGNINLVVEY